ncbi:MAG: c-type cytochrome [Planctomycetaceae bacterium]|nr:c-type cytochrome [Planctomycetaceae bacterium]
MPSLTGLGAAGTVDREAAIRLVRYYQGIVPLNPIANMPRFALRPRLAALVTIVVALIPQSGFAQSPPPLVVETDPLSPEEQRARFHVPAGFEIQLVASDPDIGQPMNMNFDAQGRLWVTSSVEYPYPVAGEGVEPREERWGNPEDRQPRDWVAVLSGIDDSGKPAQITRFAEGLNIPIGIIPDGDGAIVYSIPNIERFRDIDGDGKADERTKLYGPFGNLDTHGMVNSFTRGLDGWIYACHGFRNTSKVHGTDGHVIEMNSGNTFRFKPDGSRIEHWTNGQVNPFGLCFDPWGNLYSADCHSMPLTCLLRGAYYQSFGKPHDGLGFGPDMIDHNHGSTGICGCAWYEADQFPPEYNGCIFLCNPVTGRVHRDKIEFRGSSPWVNTQADFITCDDGWFRPVDVKLGPDGALYIADFYNAIIGHYEVPLEHPKRDRTHGRIWRVVYRGARDGEPGVENPETRQSKPNDLTPSRLHRGNAGPCPAEFELTNLSLPQLVGRLGDPNLTVQFLVTAQIAAALQNDASVTEFHTLLASPDRGPTGATGRALAVHLLARSGSFPPQLASTLSAGDSELLQTHICRAIGEAEGDLARQLRTLLPRQLSSRPAIRAYIEAWGQHHLPLDLRDAVLFSGDASKQDLGDDPQAAHTLRIAQRNLLTTATVLETALARPLEWVDAALGQPSPAGAAVLLAALSELHTPTDRRQAIQQIARYGEASQIERLVTSTSARKQSSRTAQLSDLRSVQAGLLQRGGDHLELLQGWSTRLATELLDQPVARQIGWTPVAYGPNAKPESAFGVQPRPFADGQNGALLHSSFPPGETGTGILRSDAFDLPHRLSFFIAGHNGLPSQPVTPNNLIRLRDAETQSVLKEALPPRNDTAQPVDWDLSDQQGRRGYLEIVDGDNRTAYAWLAVGRFSVDGLNPTTESPQLEACRLVAELKLTDLAPRLAELAHSSETPGSLRSEAAGALLSLHPDARLAVLREAAVSIAVSEQLREQCYSTIATHSISVPNAQDVAPLLKTIVQAAPADVQRQLATLLAGDRHGAETCLTLVEQGAASARLLQDAGLVERLRTFNLEGFDSRLEKLTADLPEADAALVQLVQQRRESFRQTAASHDAVRGQAVFKQHCAACHQIGGEGARIGPQLDGVGLRGPDRLLEDILDPNRNVDAAFKSKVLVLNDGRIVTGLFRREEGATLVLADNQGKEFTVAADEVELKKDSALSLMPAQLGDKIPEADLAHLVDYLLSTRTPKADSP